MQNLKKARTRARQAEARVDSLLSEADAASLEIQCLRNAVELRGNFATEAREQVCMLLVYEA